MQHMIADALSCVPPTLPSQDQSPRGTWDPDRRLVARQLQRAQSRSSGTALIRGLLRHDSNAFESFVTWDDPAVSACAGRGARAPHHPCLGLQLQRV